MSERSYWQRSERIVGPAKAADFGEIGQVATRTAFETFIVRASGPPTRLLDAGCNTGVEGFRLFAAGYAGRYVGVDSNRKALQFARENVTTHRAAWVEARLEALPWPGGAFDITLSKDVIEHLADFRPSLAELCRVTAEYLILSFFIKPTPRRARLRRHRRGYFLNRYDRRELLAFVESQGFEYVDSLFEDQSDEVLLWRRESTRSRSTQRS